MKPNTIRNIIPFGIFFLIFFSLLVSSLIICGGYFYYDSKSRIAEIESYTRNYSIPLAEAFAKIAEYNYRNRNFSGLRELFNEKIQEDIIDEAFFVLSNGRLIAHSNSETEKKLKGNIATDEFAYNMDLILLPLWSKADHAQFLDYHIYDQENKKIPIFYNKSVLNFFKKYVYSKIDVVGWLVTRAVYINGKGIGCVSFIISKDRIFDFLKEHINRTIKLSILLSFSSFVISIFISFIVFFRYKSMRSCQRIQVRDERSGVNDRMTIKEAIKIKSVLSGKAEVKDMKNKTVKDAILVIDKSR